MAFKIRTQVLDFRVQYACQKNFAHLRLILLEVDPSHTSSHRCHRLHQPSKFEYKCRIFEYGHDKGKEGKGAMRKRMRVFYFEALTGNILVQ